MLDSGAGGLSVLREAVSLLPHESFLFYGDQGNAPYGTKSKQEVLALVRAVIAPGDVLILDEPFKGLDDDTRGAAMRYVLNHAADRLILLVTHDRAEAEAMGALKTIQIGGDEA